MTESPKNCVVDKMKIIEEIANLARLLAMIPSDDTYTINEPMTRKSMELSKWLDEARNSFFKLSVQINKALDLNLH